HDLARKGFWFAGIHLDLALLAETLAAPTRLGIDRDQSIIRRAEENARFAGAVLRRLVIDPMGDAATFLDAHLRILRIEHPTLLAGARIERDQAPRRGANHQIAFDEARLIFECDELVDDLLRR